MSDVLLTKSPAVERPRAEVLVRRVLFVQDTPRKARARATASAHRLFSLSMVLSGIRCLLGYIVLPVLAPALGVATSVEPYFGIPIGVVALVFDVRGIRRFWIADHRYRWPISAVYVAVMALVMTLLVSDVLHLAG